MSEGKRWRSSSTRGELPRRRDGAIVYEAVHSTTQHDCHARSTIMHANTQLVGDDRDLIPAGTFH
jgi:hypothetical protein